MTGRSESAIHSFTLPDDQRGLRETANLIESGKYDQLAELLRLSQAASERVGQSFLAEMFSAARNICLACSRSRSEKDLHRQAEEEAGGREWELNQQLHAMLEKIAQTTVSAIPALGNSPDPAVPERDRPSAGVANSLSILCLGPFRVYRDKHMIGDWHSLKGLLILKYMVRHHKTPVAKDVLMDVFWPEADQEVARRNLHQAIYNLRQILRRASTAWRSDMSAKHPDTTNNQQPDSKLGQEPNFDNDLLKIKGVTKEVEQALKKVGINTYEKLVGYNANHLSNILKANDPPISLSQVKLETIITKASDFTRSTPKQERVQTIPEAALTGKKKRQYERHWENWEELADFFVSFGYKITKSGEKILETRVINYERDENQQWQDVATDQLLEWIISRSNAPLAQEGQTKTRKSELIVRPSAAPVAKEAKIVELTEPVVSEIVDPSEAESPDKQSGRLRVENCLKLSEAALAGQSYNKLIALTEIYLYNKQTQQRQMVAHQTCQYVPGNFTYEIKQDFPPPEVGNYQLYQIARLFPLGETAYAEGPVICVRA